MTNSMFPIQEHPIFKDMPQVWRTVMPHVRQKICKKQEAVAYHGDPASRLWLILRGWVKLSRQTPDGAQTVLGLCTTGDIVGEAAFFAQSNYTSTIETLTDDVVLASIPTQAIQTAMLTHSRFATHIMALLGERMNRMQIKTEHMSTLSAAQRLGCFLLGLCHPHGNTTCYLHLPVEKHLIASYLGMKPETLSRSFQHIKSLQIDVNGVDICVNNINLLRQFVCGSCSESGACETEAALTLKTTAAIRSSMTQKR